ncbi:hypothetical protein [Pseudoruegeria sp. HB172150]|uniref:hypothetical protein n=1 Tax=Pseudoruegeria sp. HB172150 TaxID=2721164 RepID=UPI0015570BE3|nr:hypothetical protein [Pseudoruegeria sp. HB172150]
MGLLITMVLGLLAAVAATYTEDQVKEWLDDFLMAEQRLSPAELRLFALLAYLMLAALLSWVIGNGGAVPLIFGAMLGIFIPRAIDGFVSSNKD